MTHPSNHASSPGPRSPEVGCNESQPNRSSMRECFRRNTGLLLITLSQSCFSSMNVAVKKLNSLDIPVPTMELIVVRMVLTALFSLSYMIITGVNDPFLGPKDLRWILVLRGAAGFVGLSGLYLSLEYLSLSDATVLTFLAPICLVFTGAIFLGESFHLGQVFAGLMSLGGVILIARPTFLFGPSADLTHLWINLESTLPADRLISVWVSLVGVIGATTAFTTIRAIGKRAHAMHSMVYYSVTCVLCSAASMVVTGTPFVVPTSIEWLLLLILIGVFGFMGQLLLTKGLQCETVGRGSIGMYTQIIFATIFQRIFFHSYPTLYSVLGIFLISGSALYVALSNASSEEGIKTGEIRLPEDNDTEGLVGRQTVGADAA